MSLRLSSGSDLIAECDDPECENSMFEFQFDNAIGELHQRLINDGWDVEYGDGPPDIRSHDSIGPLRATGWRHWCPACKNEHGTEGRGEYRKSWPLRGAQWFAPVVTYEEGEALLAINDAIGRETGFGTWNIVHKFWPKLKRLIERIEKVRPAERLATAEKQIAEARERAKEREQP